MSHPLKGIFGAAYACSNPSITYCDDWYTTQYKPVYDNPQLKKSLHHLKTLGINTVRTYYLDPNRNHADFLTVCSNLKIAVEIGISNNLLDQRNTEQIRKLVNEVRNFPCVKLYTVGNEYFGDIENIRWGVETVWGIDNSKYIMHSSIFDHNFESASRIYQRIPDHIKPKYIVGINMYFYGNPPKQQGDVVQNVVRDYYNHPILRTSFLIISEYGRNDDSWESIWNYQWGNSEALKKYPNYLGWELFSYSNESWKGSGHGENNYGILTEDGREKQTYYAIRDFKNTDAFRQTIKSSFL